MRTTILAYAIAFMGLIMIGRGLWGQRERPPAVGTCHAPLGRAGADMKNRVIAGLWLAFIIGVPASAGSGSVRIGFGLFLVVFLASGIAPAIYVGLKAK